MKPSKKQRSLYKRLTQLDYYIADAIEKHAGEMEISYSTPPGKVPIKVEIWREYRGEHLGTYTISPTRVTVHSDLGWFKRVVEKAVQKYMAMSPKQRLALRDSL